MLGFAVPASIRRFGLFSAALRRHVLEKFATLIAAPLVVTRLGRSVRNQWYRGSSDGKSGNADVKRLRLAIVLHAYYPEVVAEALACRERLGMNVSLLVTSPPSSYHDVESALANAPGVQLFVTENCGRDIAPFLWLLAQGHLDRYDAVLKIHSKRSKHLIDGRRRRLLLFEFLCGAPNATWRALQAFCDPYVGVVGWGACYRKTMPFWMANEERVAEIAQAIKAQDCARLGFFEGSMFWFRPIAFARLRALGLNAGDFEAESGQTDGTLHHAIERVFTIAAWADGFKVCDLQGRTLPGGPIALRRPAFSVSPMVAGPGCLPRSE